MSTNRLGSKRAAAIADTASNWFLGVPTSGQDVSISLSSAGTVTHSQTNAEQVNSLTTNANTTLSVTAGSIALAASGSSSFGGPVTFNTGSSLTMGNGAKLAVAVNQVLTVNGSVSFRVQRHDHLRQQLRLQHADQRQRVVHVRDRDHVHIGRRQRPVEFRRRRHFGATGTTFSLSQISLGGTTLGRGRPLKQHLQCAAMRARVGRGLPGGVAQRRGDEQ